jgi:hypothetical protein
MKSAYPIALGSLLVLALAAFTAEEHAARGDASFAASISGDIHTTLRGDAKYGVVNGKGDAPTVFTLSLGANGRDGSVLFTRTNGVRIVPGTYAVTGRDDGTDEVRALVMTGSAEHPNGVFRADSGTLVVTSTGDNVIRGSFRVDATGFLAADPANEDRQIRASGGFTAFRD